MPAGTTRWRSSRGTSCSPGPPTCSPTWDPRPYHPAQTFERLCAGQIRETVGPGEIRTGSPTMWAARGQDRLADRDRRRRRHDLRCRRHDHETMAAFAERMVWPSSSATTWSTSAPRRTVRRPPGPTYAGVAALAVLSPDLDGPDDARLIKLTSAPIHDDAGRAEARASARHPAMGRAQDEAHRWAAEARQTLAPLPACPAPAPSSYSATTWSSGPLDAGQRPRRRRHGVPPA